MTHVVSNWAQPMAVEVVLNKSRGIRHVAVFIGMNVNRKVVTFFHLQLVSDLRIEYKALKDYEF